MRTAAMPFAGAFVAPRSSCQTLPVGSPLRTPISTTTHLAIEKGEHPPSGNLCPEKEASTSCQSLSKCKITCRRKMQNSGQARFSCESAPMLPLGKHMHSAPPERTKKKRRYHVQDVIDQFCKPPWALVFGAAEEPNRGTESAHLPVLSVLHMSALESTRDPHHVVRQVQLPGPRKTRRRGMHLSIVVALPLWPLSRLF